MKNKQKTGLFVVGAFLLAGMTSCNKEYAEFKNQEVVQNTYAGEVIITSTGTDPAGDFTGEEASGTYSFAWENPEKKATVNFDITTDGAGSIQVIVNDAKGEEVLNETRSDVGEDTFSGVTLEGKSGTWLVTLVLNNVDGDGSFSINPEE